MNAEVTEALKLLTNYIGSTTSTTTSATHLPPLTSYFLQPTRSGRVPSLALSTTLAPPVNESYATDDIPIPRDTQLFNDYLWFPSTDEEDSDFDPITTVTPFETTHALGTSPPGGAGTGTREWNAFDGMEDEDEIVVDSVASTSAIRATRATTASASRGNVGGTMKKGRGAKGVTTIRRLSPTASPSSESNTLPSPSSVSISLPPTTIVQAKENDPSTGKRTRGSVLTPSELAVNKRARNAQHARDSRAKLKAAKMNQDDVTKALIEEKDEMVRVFKDRVEELEEENRVLRGKVERLSRNARGNGGESIGSDGLSASSEEDESEEEAETAMEEEADADESGGSEWSEDERPALEIASDSGVDLNDTNDDVRERVGGPSTGTGTTTGMNELARILEWAARAQHQQQQEQQLPQKRRGK